MWASHGLDRFCVRPYCKLGPELQVWFCVRPYFKLGPELQVTRLLTPGERNALTKSKVHKISWAHDYDPRVDLLTDLKNMAVDLPGVG